MVKTFTVVHQCRTICWSILPKPWISKIKFTMRNYKVYCFVWNAYYIEVNIHRGRVSHNYLSYFVWTLCNSIIIISTFWLIKKFLVQTIAVRRPIIKKVFSSYDQYWQIANPKFLITQTCKKKGSRIQCFIFTKLILIFSTVLAIYVHFLYQMVLCTRKT